jgi:Ran GTPase-activating protein (RanGAP) involved in mRNA processing and transport
LIRSLNTSLNNFLQHINFDNCNLGPLGAIYIANAVQLNKNLRIVSLRKNMIKFEGARAFADLFKFLSISIEHLDLSENNIPDEGGKLLAIGLQKNESLRYLNLQTNILAEESATEFLKAAKKN